MCNSCGMCTRCPIVCRSCFVLFKPTSSSSRKRRWRTPRCVTREFTSPNNPFNIRAACILTCISPTYFGVVITDDPSSLQTSWLKQRKSQHWILITIDLIFILVDMHLTCFNATVSFATFQILLISASVLKYLT